MAIMTIAIEADPPCLHQRVMLINKSQAIIGFIIAATSKVTLLLRFGPPAKVFTIGDGKNSASQQFQVEEGTSASHVTDQSTENPPLP
jgi:hypothetical protein